MSPQTHEHRRRLRAATRALRDSERDSRRAELHVVPTEPPSTTSGGAFWLLVGVVLFGVGFVLIASR